LSGPRKPERVSWGNVKKSEEKSRQKKNPEARELGESGPKNEGNKGSCGEKSKTSEEKNIR